MVDTPDLDRLAGNIPAANRAQPAQAAQAQPLENIVQPQPVMQAAPQQQAAPAQVQPQPQAGNQRAPLFGGTFREYIGVGATAIGTGLAWVFGGDYLVSAGNFLVNNTSSFPWVLDDIFGGIGNTLVEKANWLAPAAIAYLGSNILPEGHTLRKIAKRGAVGAVALGLAGVEYLGIPGASAIKDLSDYVGLSNFGAVPDWIGRAAFAGTAFWGAMGLAQGAYTGVKNLLVGRNANQEGEENQGGYSALAKGVFGLGVAALAGIGSYIGTDLILDSYSQHLLTKPTTSELFPGTPSTLPVLGSWLSGAKEDVAAAATILGTYIGSNYVRDTAIRNGIKGAVGVGITAAAFVVGAGWYSPLIGIAGLGTLEVARGMYSSLRTQPNPAAPPGQH